VSHPPAGGGTKVFRSPSVLLTGPGCSAEAGRLAAGLGVRRALAVVDSNVRAAGGAAPVLESCAGAGLAVSVYEGVTTEPVLEYVEAALDLLREGRCDGVIAVGGGSVIDTAKAAAALATNGGRLPDYQGVDQFRAPALPLVAVPTTAGTGSEATRVAVVTDGARNVKMMLMADALLPRAAVDDARLTVSVPPGPTAAAGLDALTHAVEAYLSRRAQPLTDTLALAAIRTIVACLPRAWRDGGDLAAREGMMTAQLQAGLAFSNSSVALVHGMARPLGAHFGVPHGLANAVLLPAVLRFSLPGDPDRFGRIAEAMGAGSDGLAAVEAVEALARDLEVPTLAGLGVDPEHFRTVTRQMAEDALASGSPANNPRLASAEEICALYEAVYAGDRGT
jgi:alcohol dehydrogenase class IV